MMYLLWYPPPRDYEQVVFMELVCTWMTLLEFILFTGTWRDQVGLLLFWSYSKGFMAWFDPKFFCANVAVWYFYWTSVVFVWVCTVTFSYENFPLPSNGDCTIPYFCWGSWCIIQTLLWVDDSTINREVENQRDLHFFHWRGPGQSQSEVSAPGSP